MSITVVFLAAGLSTRFRRPKQLEPVGPSGQSLLDYGIFDALRGGADRIVLVTRPSLRPALQDHLEQVFGALPVSFVLQHSVGGRMAGTGHAVLAAADMVRGHFAVANADDFYGHRAWALLLDYLKALHTEDSYALVGYPLSATLSASGGVSRALCQVDDGGMVATIQEWHDVRREATTINGVDLTGHSAVLEGGAMVSMNLWGFTPSLFGLLRRQFASFERQAMAGTGAEFLLSEAINAQVHERRATVRVLTGPDGWCGLTHPADYTTVGARLDALTSGGTYPARFDRHP